MTLACSCANGGVQTFLHLCLAKPILGAVVATGVGLATICGVNYAVSKSPKDCTGQWVETEQVCVTPLPDNAVSVAY